MMAKRGWLLFSACTIGLAWLGCGADKNTPPANGNGIGQTDASAMAPNERPMGGSGAGADAGAGTGQPGETPDPADAGAPADAGSAGEEQWTLLMEESWTLEPGGEVPQWCGDLVLEEDVYVSAIRPVHPPGTHHTTLSVTETQTACSTAAVFQNGIIYAAGVGTEVLRMPEGVAMKLPKDFVLHLGLHLYNTSDQELSGVSGIEVIRVAPEDVVHEAELMLSGPFRLDIAPGRHTVSHTCNVTEDQTIFALFPHMHQAGMHMKATVTVDGEPKLIHDAPYDFEEQYHLALDPLDLQVGDSITTECTYENTTGSKITFGESSDTEMCFSIWFRYPATGNSFCGRTMR